MTGQTISLIAVLREDLVNARNERDAYANELQLCEQDLRHALTRISELCEQLEALQRDATVWWGRK